jgi:hypothetical protein
MRRTRRLAPHDLRHAARAEAGRSGPRHRLDHRGAVNYFSAALSIPTWERFTIERSWSSEQYIERMSWALKRVLLREL